METNADESSKTPIDEKATEEVQASAEKKDKKKKWYRKLSFTTKDKSKPTIKESAAVDVKTETVEEVRNNKIKNCKNKVDINGVKLLSVMVELIYIIIIVEDYFKLYN